MYLIASSLGLYQHGVSFDSFLANILQKDKKDFEILLCDGVLPACQMSKLSRTTSKQLAENGQSDVCRRCTKRGKDRIKVQNSSLTKHIRLYSEFVSAEKIHEITQICSSLSENELRTLRLSGAPVGEHGYASALRFFARGDLDGEEFALAILRKFVIGAAISYEIFHNLFSKKNFEKTIIHHGIYTPQGLAVAAAKKHGVGIVTWIKSYRDQTFLFSHQDTYHHTMISETKSEWSGFDLNKQSEIIIDEYVASRRSGTDDWISFNTNPTPVISDNKIEYECLMLTSVLWDAQVHYKANLFSGILDWVFQTISFWIKEKKTARLCIRIHPAESTGYITSRQRVGDEIYKAFPMLPDNIVIIQPENKVSTYDLVMKSKYVVAYSTKASIEVGVMGKPVIVCGDAWIRNKGISVDPKTELAYFSLLKNPETISKFTSAKRHRAKKYAFHFFMRRMLKIDCFDQNEKGEIEFNIEAFENPSDSLLDSLDVIKNGLYKEGPFILKKELIQSKDPEISILQFIGKISYSRVLQSENEISFACNMLEKLGLPLHHDKSKNWDLLKVATALSEKTRKCSRILDAGCGRQARLTRLLMKSGYQNIYACDLNNPDFHIYGPYNSDYNAKITRKLRKLKKIFFDRDTKKENLEVVTNEQYLFSLQDLTSTSYPSNFFDAVCSISVLEHLGSYKKFIEEMSRIIRTGGELLLTTDYWPQKVHTSNIFPYGTDQTEMKIFSAEEIKELIEFAKKNGLLIQDKVELGAETRVCTWERVDRKYTFIFLRFYKS